MNRSLCSRWRIALPGCLLLAGCPRTYGLPLGTLAPLPGLARPESREATLHLAAGAGAGTMFDGTLGVTGAVSREVRLGVVGQASVRWMEGRAFIMVNPRVDFLSFTFAVHGGATGGSNFEQPFLGPDFLLRLGGKTSDGVQAWVGLGIGASFLMGTQAGRSQCVTLALFAPCDSWSWYPWAANSLGPQAEVALQAQVHPGVRVGGGLRMDVAVPYDDRKASILWVVSGAVTAEFVLTTPTPAR